MNIIKPSFEILDNIDGKEILRKVEKAGRICYKSEANMNDSYSENFLKDKIRLGHESIIEHEKITVKIVCDRGVTHELVRHRIASYSQESTRYCNYCNNKFNNEITLIKPCYWDENSDEYKVWLEAMAFAEKTYFSLMEMGAKPQEARSILPNSLKTEIIVTMNLREWRHFFKLRTDKASHPQMREVANMILRQFKNLIPIIFDDIVGE